MFTELSPVAIISLASIFAITVLMLKGIKIVPQSHALVIERLGKYNRTIEGGFHIIIPIIDSVALSVTKQEQTIDIPEQSVITKDNVNISVDGIVFIQVENAKDAAYGVVNFKRAIGNLAMTTLRAEIGKMALDETLSSRDTLNLSILNALDEASQKWGIKTMRVELRDISVPKEIEDAMNLEMKAEREKRAIELTASANKKATILEAEGDKQKTILEAEAIQKMADALRYEQIALAKGQEAAMEAINTAMAQNEKAAEFLLAKERIVAFKALAESNSKDKVIVPYNTAEMIGSFSVMKDFIGVSEATA